MSQDRPDSGGLIIFLLFLGAGANLLRVFTKYWGDPTGIAWSIGTAVVLLGLGLFLYRRRGGKPLF